MVLLGGFDGTESSLGDRAGLFAETVLSGDLLGDDGPDFTGVDDNSFHVLRAVSVSSSTRLDGFTIRGGNADVNTTEGGGGMFLSHASPRVDRCAFRANAATAGKGGGFSSSGGAVFNIGGAPTFIDCLFQGNRAAGVGGASSGFGGAVYNFNSADPTFVHCRFLGQSRRGFGGRRERLRRRDLQLLPTATRR